mgnify:FL=1
MNAAPAPVSSIRSVGADPEPYFYPESGQRSDRSSYLRVCFYSPRPEYTHVPVAPSELFCAFREHWEGPGIRENHDLGAIAEATLDAHVDDGSRESRLYRRFLSLCATVLPRPFAEYDRKWGLTPQAA